MIGNMKSEKSDTMCPSAGYVAPFVRVTSVTGLSSFMSGYGSGDYFNEEENEGEWDDE